jgi:hypothetical protein
MDGSGVNEFLDRLRRRGVARIWGGVAVILIFASVCVMLRRQARMPGFLWQTTSIETGQIIPEIGFSYESKHGKGRLSSHVERAPALLLENGVLLGPGNCLHADIRALGQGRFSFWYDYVYFSSSDNSDPRTNGRRYEIQAPLFYVGRSTALALYGLTLACYVLGTLLWARELRQGAGRLGKQLMRAVSHAATSAREGSWPRKSLPVLAPVSLALMMSAAGVFICRQANEPNYMWRKYLIGTKQIVPEVGFSYEARHGMERVSSHVERSPALLLENGVPLGPGNCLHADIRFLGQGRFSFWHDYVYFSASDNSDPRTNGWTYEIQAPLLYVGSGTAGALYVLAAVSCILLVYSLSTEFPHIAAPIQKLFKSTFGEYSVIWLGVSAIALIALAKAYPFLFLHREVASPSAGGGRTSLVHTCAWIFAIAVNLAAAFVIRRRFGNGYPKWIKVTYVVAMAISYYLLTVVAVGRTESDGVSSWNSYFVDPDSGSYVEKYSPATSSRPPVVPLFVDLVTAGTGFKHDLTGYNSNTAQSDLTIPLLRVVRAQKILLLAASLLASYSLMGLMGPSFSALLFLGLYDLGFYTHEINHVLSEPLAQTWLLLLLAVFFAFVRERRKWLLILAGILCAALFLTRPAGAFGILFLLAMILLAVGSDWKRYSLPAVLSVALMGGLAAMPGFLYYLKCGYFVITPHGSAKVAFALQVAKPEDVSLMPDEQCRRFLREALEKKKIEDAKIIPAHPDEIDRMCWLLSSNLNSVAWSVRKEPRIFSTVGDLILKEHRVEYLKIAAKSFLYSTTDYGLKSLGRFRVNFWFVVMASAMVAILVRGWVGLSIITLMGAHLSHLLIVSFYDAPIPRYILATEFLVLVAAFISLWALIFVIPWKKLRREVIEIAAGSEAGSVTDEGRVIGRIIDGGKCDSVGMRWIIWIAVPAALIGIYFVTNAHPALYAFTICTYYPVIGLLVRIVEPSRLVKILVALAVFVAASRMFAGHQMPNSKDLVAALSVGPLEVKGGQAIEQDFWLPGSSWRLGRLLADPSIKAELRLVADEVDLDGSHLYVNGKDVGTIGALLIRKDSGRFYGLPVYNYRLKCPKETLGGAVKITIRISAGKGFRIAYTSGIHPLPLTSHVRIIEDDGSVRDLSNEYYHGRFRFAAVIYLYSDKYSTESGSPLLFGTIY